MMVMTESSTVVQRKLIRPCLDLNCDPTNVERTLLLLCYPAVFVLTLSNFKLNSALHYSYNIAQSPFHLASPGVFGQKFFHKSSLEASLIICQLSLLFNRAAEQHLRGGREKTVETNKKMKNTRVSFSFSRPRTKVLS